LNKNKEDLFLDVFSADYIKIIKAIERKKEAIERTQDTRRDDIHTKFSNLGAGIANAQN